MRFLAYRSASTLRFKGSLVAVGLAVGGMSLAATAETFRVSNTGNIDEAISRARPGDTIVMQDGVWTDRDIQFAADGAEGSPITLRAQTPGRVVLNGSSKLHISGNYLIVRGLRFQGGALRENEHIVEFRGRNGQATNSRLTGSAFIDYNPRDPSTRYHWVALYGEDNRVDRNFFKGQNHSGVTVVSNHTEGVTARHRIDRNHFVDRPRGDGNGFETIRIGTGAVASVNSEVWVFLNLFERTNGETEVVSNKSTNSEYSYNTFRNVEGALTLRNGGGNRVNGNFFLGEGNPRAGGIRIVGANQTVTNNYFQDSGAVDGGVIALRKGGETTSGAEYQRVDNVLIANNTIVNPLRTALQMSSGNAPDFPRKVVVANNVIVGSNRLFAGTEGPDWIWEDNVAYSPLGVSPSRGITVIDSSREIDRHVAMARQRIVIEDRLPNSQDLIRQPLSGSQVGPSWLSRRSVGYDGRGIDAIVIEAETFTARTDPNRDSDTWTVVDEPSASGMRVLKAPSGGYEDQDAIAEYDVAFHDPGQYHLYLRSRGFSTGSNSLFYPSGFDQEPTIVENTSTDGSWEWVLVDSFTVSQSEVNLPRTLRLGKREQGTEIDMLVLTPGRDLADPVR